MAAATVATVADRVAVVMATVVAAREVAAREVAVTVRAVAAREEVVRAAAEMETEVKGGAMVAVVRAAVREVAPTGALMAVSAALTAVSGAMARRAEVLAAARRPAKRRCRAQSSARLAG